MYNICDVDALESIEFIGIIFVAITIKLRYLIVTNLGVFLCYTIGIESVDPTPPFVVLQPFLQKGVSGGNFFVIDIGFYLFTYDTFPDFYVSFLCYTIDHGN